MSIFPTRILLATDGSEEAELAAITATNLAQKTGSELHVVHVFGVAPVGPPVHPEATELEGVDQEAEALQLQGISERQAREVLDAAAEKVRSVGGTVVEEHLIEGRVAQEIVALAEKLETGLIVLGSRGLSPLKRALMGSVSASVVRHAHCPVLVVRDGEHERDHLPGKILLAVDGSTEAQAAASTAVEVAVRMGSELHVVHVGEVRPVYHPERHGYHARYEELREEAQRLLEEQVAQVVTAGGRVAGTHLEMGRPDEEIVVLGEEIGAGFIVVGSRGLGPLKRALIGSVSDSVVRHSYCSVLVVRKEQ